MHEREKKERNKIGGVTGERERRRRKETELFSGKYAGSRFITASSFFKPCQVLRLTKIIKQLSDPSSSHRTVIFISRALFPPLLLSFSLSVEEKTDIIFVPRLRLSIQTPFAAPFHFLSTFLISEFVRVKDRLVVDF